MSNVAICEPISSIEHRKGVATRPMRPSKPLRASILFLLGVLLHPDLGAQDFGFQPPELLNSNGLSDVAEDSNVSVATDRFGNWVAVWHTGGDLGGTIGFDGDILVSRSADNGSTWTAAAPLHTDATTDTVRDGWPTVATDRNGVWVAAWWSFDDPTTVGSVLASRSLDDGATWSTPALITTHNVPNAGFASLPQVAADAAGNFLVLWSSTSDLGGAIGDDLDILYSRSADGASWSPPAALAPNAATDVRTDSYPRISTDRNGTWLATWDSGNGFGDEFGNDLDVFFSRSTDGGTSWSLPAPLNSNANADSGQDQYPVTTTDGNGNWIAVWSSWDTFGDTIGNDFDILYTRSSDNAASWSPVAPLNTNAAIDSRSDNLVAIATDEVGHWLAVWASSEPLDPSIGGDDDILAARSQDNGATWSPPVPPRPECRL